MNTIAMLLAVLLAGHWLFRQIQPEARGERQEKLPRPAKKSSRVAHPYQGASIKHGKNPCAAVKRYANRRMLSTQAPQLPLVGCSAAQCKCRYQRHNDRRSSVDRRDAGSPLAALYALDGETERRQRAFRRESDRASKQSTDLGYDDFEWGT